MEKGFVLILAIDVGYLLTVALLGEFGLAGRVVATLAVIALVRMFATKVKSHAQHESAQPKAP